MNGIITSTTKRMPSDRSSSDPELLPGIVSVHPTRDIDRAGSKGQIDVTAENPGSPRPNMRIGRTGPVTHTGGLVDRSRTRFAALTSPGDYPVRVSCTTVPSVWIPAHRRNSRPPRASDIIDDNRRCWSPRRRLHAGRCVTSCRMCPVAVRQMATCGIMGRTWYRNNGFEDGTSGWSSCGSYALSQ